jgi:hypothetical protein
LDYDLSHFQSRVKGFKLHVLSNARFRLADRVG